MIKEDFQLVARIMLERAGLALSEDKEYLVESRLMPVARNRGMKGLEDLVSAVRLDPTEDLLVEVTDAMMTNESFFFRDLHPFEVFRKTVLPALAEARREKGIFKIRVWSAACSSGQEPYSLAMIVREEPGLLKDLEVEIVGTDLSSTILTKAKSGLYSQFEVQRGLPVTMLAKYFTQDGSRWKIAESLKSMVTFRPFNLHHNYTALGQFDVIFCRNVLIYFDQAAKKSILERMARIMPEDGILYLGGAESVLGLSDAFKPLPGLRGVYGKSAAIDALRKVG